MIEAVTHKNVVVTEAGWYRYNKGKWERLKFWQSHNDKDIYLTQSQLIEFGLCQIVGYLDKELK